MRPVMKKILLVDDDPSFLAVAGYLLRKHRYHVVACSSGEEAIELLESNGFGLVISDFRMGQVSGLRVASTALMKNPPIPVIILTAYADGLTNAIDQEFRERSRRYYPNLVLTKPIDERKLINAIENLGINADQEVTP